MYLPFVDLGLSFYSLVFLTFFPLCQLFLLDRYWKVTNPGDPLCFAYICHLLFTYTHICFIVNSWPFGFFPKFFALKSMNKVLHVALYQKLC